MFHGKSKGVWSHQQNATWALYHSGTESYYSKKVCEWGLVLAERSQTVQTINVALECVAPSIRLFGESKYPDSMHSCREPDDTIATD